MLLLMRLMLLLLPCHWLLLTSRQALGLLLPLLLRGSRLRRLLLALGARLELRGVGDHVLVCSGAVLEAQAGDALLQAGQALLAAAGGHRHLEGLPGAHHHHQLLGTRQSCRQQQTFSPAM